MTEPTTDQMRPVLVVAAIALTSMRSLLESISDGQSVPSLGTIERAHDLCSTALAAIDGLGVDPPLHEEPD